MTELVTEADYHKAWQQTFTGTESPVDLAFRGGQLADRFAWVFAAGYQAAMRDTFPALAGPAWAAFCVSEGKDGLPPLASSSGAQGVTVSGHKTWVAAASVVTRLVVKINRGEAALFREIALPHRGVTMSWQSSRFLPEMCQGQAAFEGVPLTEFAALDEARLSLFGLNEAMYIYLAFTGLLSREHSVDELQQRLASWLQEGQQGPAALAEAAELDRLVQQALAQASSLRHLDDARLIRMYSPMIARRAAAST